MAALLLQAPAVGKLRFAPYQQANSRKRWQVTRRASFRLQSAATEDGWPREQTIARSDFGKWSRVAKCQSFRDTPVGSKQWPLVLTAACWHRRATAVK